jgi:hypothetical protein
MSEPIMRSSARWVVALCLSAILAGAAIPLRPILALQPGLSNAPILLIVNRSASNTLGSYLGEILRAEGLNAFDQAELNNLTAAQLAQYDLAILAQTPLSSAQARLFNAYVAGGGALLAMRPDAQLNSLFGLSGSAGTLTNGYLQIQNNAVFNNAAPGYGLTPATLQIHGHADQYALAPGAVMLAQLYSTATVSTVYPAVVAASSGSGQSVAFTYDLPSNVAYTRQGNPANANLDVDGDHITRTIDLFQAAGGGAPWIDRDKIPIPQADEQQRLFARLVQQLAGRRRPLPQLWYFPGTAKSMLILTADAHWNGIADYTNLIADTNNHHGRITVYLSDRLVQNGNSWDWPSDEDLHAWQARGNTFGLHPWRLRGSTLASGFDSADSWFASTYTVPRSNTARVHEVQWQGWTDGADVEAAHNLGMDFSFYHWGPWLQKPDGTWPHGYITGSGLPMKFVRPDGTLTPVYQQLTEMVDEQLLTEQGGFERLTGSQAVSLSRSLIDASLAGNYSALTDIHHVDNYSTNPQLSIWLKGAIDYAVSKSVPVWNADQWLSFTQTRHAANYNNVVWNSSTGVLSFDIGMAATAGLTPTTILPLNYGGLPLQSVTIDGGASTFSVQTIKSVNVAFVGIPAGNHSVSATYSVAPAATTRGPAPMSTAMPGPARTAATTAAPASTASTCPVDTSVADFSAGTPDARLDIAQAADGELILAPTIGTEFSGTALPAGWLGTPWAPGGRATVRGGVVTVDGALIRTNAYYSPTHSVEFVATFGANTSEHAGFGTDLNAAPWAIFSTGYPRGTTLVARTNSGSGSLDTDLGSSYLGAPHRYRIDWTPTGTVYSIDGARVASHAIAITASMRPAGSDLAGGPALAIHWLRMSPYAATGVYVSRLLDAGTAARWLNLIPLRSQPAGTSLAFETRTGNTTTPDDGTWSVWAPVAGTTLSSPDGRYAQYRVTLSSADPATSPAVQQVTITYQTSRNRCYSVAELPGRRPSHRGR